jgi:hypothetical protein
VKIKLARCRAICGICLAEILALILFIIGVAAFVAMFGYWLYLVAKAIIDNWNRRIDDAQKEPGEGPEENRVWFQKPQHYFYAGPWPCNTFPSRRETS